jgi:hypothetical protein
MPSFGYPRGVSQSARICPETRQREERGQIGRRKRRRITCSCWGQGHASTMIRRWSSPVRSGAGSHGRGGTTTGGRSHCREDSGAGSHGRGNRGPEPLPGGLGGWKPRPREPGAGATAGRTRGLEATAEGTGGQNHCREEEPEWGPEPLPGGPGARGGAGMGAGAAPMQSAEQSVKRSRRIQKYSLLLKTPAHANTHTTHPEGSFGGRKPRPREPGAGATAGRVVDRSRSREQQVNRGNFPARS